MSDRMEIRIFKMPFGEEEYVKALNAYKEEKYEQAAALCKKAVAMGHVDAKDMLAGLYLEGKGVEPNHKESMRLFKEAIKEGSHHAKANYAVNGLLKPAMKEKEDPAVAKEKVKKKVKAAIKLFEQAREAKVGLGIFMLARLYDQGIPGILKPDLPKAKLLYNETIACKFSVEKAAEHLRVLSDRQLKDWVSRSAESKETKATPSVVPKLSLFDKLLLAIDTGNKEDMKRFMSQALQRGNINKQGSNGLTILNYICKQGKLNALCILIELNSSVKSKNPLDFQQPCRENFTPMMLVALADLEPSLQDQMLQCLCDAGADIHFKRKKDGHNVLGLAEQAGKENAVKKLKLLGAKSSFKKPTVAIKIETKIESKAELITETKALEPKLHKFSALSSLDLVKRAHICNELVTKNPVVLLESIQKGEFDHFSQSDLWLKHIIDSSIPVIKRELNNEKLCEKYVALFQYFFKGERGEKNFKISKDLGLLNACFPSLPDPKDEIYAWVDKVIGKYSISLILLVLCDDQHQKKLMPKEKAEAKMHKYAQLLGLKLTDPRIPLVQKELQDFPSESGLKSFAPRMTRR